MIKLAMHTRHALIFIPRFSILMVIGIFPKGSIMAIMNTKADKICQISKSAKKFCIVSIAILLNLSAKLQNFLHICKFFTNFAAIFRKYIIYTSMINSQDIKNGVCIRMDGRLYFVIEFLHVKPGKGNTIMRVKFKDVVDGRVLERRFNIGEKLEDVRVERRPYQFLYKEGADYIFMNNETYEQVPIAHDLITGVDFLKEGMTCEVVSDASTDTILFAELPTKVELAITYTEPGLKGDTATNTLKPATLETGAEIRVPLFINEGEIVRVDTRDGSYCERVR